MDFNLGGEMTAHVFLMFLPRNYSEIMQALGRGARNCLTSTTGTLICRLGDRSKIRSNMEPENLMNYLRS